jgi:hypothetical protein
MIPEPKKQMTMKEIIVEEFSRCKNSPVFFMKKYVKIQSAGKTVNFNLYPFQEETLQSFADFDNNIILKSRQMGLSTLVAAYSLWKMIFKSDQNILIISLRQEAAIEVLDKVSFANEALPSWMKVKAEENNKKSIKFVNGSSIKASSTTKKSGVGKSLALLIIDEAALLDDGEELFSSASPALSTGGQCILLSTPRGVGNFFHKMWVGAEDSIDGKTGKNGFHAIRLPWQLHPDRDEEWRRIAGLKQPSPKEAAREFDCDFLTSGDTVVDLATIDFYKKTFKKDPIECRYVDKSLWIWKYPECNSTYIVSADTSAGNDTGDYQACHVIDAVTLEQCAEYRGHINTKEFGNLLVTIATEYNNALLVIERQNTGYAVIQAVIDKSYSNLFYMTNDLKYVDVESQHNNNYNREEQKAQAGFSTNTQTRPLVISTLERYMRERTIQIYSIRTLSELETFIWKNGKAQAMQGYHDDLSMALGICLWIRDTALKLRQQGIDLTKASLSHMNKTQLDTTPVFKAQARNLAQQSWEMSTGRSPNRPLDKSNMEDLKWLL